MCDLLKNKDKAGKLLSKEQLGKQVEGKSYAGDVVEKILGKGKEPKDLTKEVLGRWATQKKLWTKFLETRMKNQ